MPYTKPVPVPDERTEGFWKAAKEHRLSIQRCQHCRHYSHPPAVACPQCRDPRPSFAWEPVSGRVRIKTWTVMRDAFLPGFADDLPYVIAIVELEEQEGLRLAARLLDGPTARLKLDAPVRVVFEDVTPEIALPQFSLA